MLSNYPLITLIPSEAFRSDPRNYLPKNPKRKMFNPDPSVLG